MAYLLIFVLAAVGFGQTAESLVEKHVEAIGGAAAVKNVKSFRMTGKIVIGGGASEAPFEAAWKYPNRTWAVYMIPGQKVVEGFDGVSKWILRPGPSPMALRSSLDESTKAAEESPVFLDALVDYKEKGGSIQYIGREEGSFRIKVTSKSGHAQTVSVNVLSYLVTRLEKEGKTVILPDDYRVISGVKVPFKLEIRVNDRAAMELRLDKAELNPEVDDALFQMPEARPRQQ